MSGTIMERIVFGSRADLNGALDDCHGPVRINQPEGWCLTYQGVRMGRSEARLRRTSRFHFVRTSGLRHGSQSIVHISNPFQDPQLQQSSVRCRDSGHHVERMLKQFD